MKQCILRILPLALLLSISTGMVQAAESPQDAFVRIAETGVAYQIIDEHEQQLLEQACNGENLRGPQQLLLLEICERVRQQAPASVSQDDVRAACESLKATRDGMREPRPGDDIAPEQDLTLNSDENPEVSVDRSNGLGVSVGSQAGVDSDVSQNLNVAVNDSTILSRNSTNGNVALSGSTLKVQNSSAFNVVASGGTLDNIDGSDAISDGINLDAGTSSVRLFSSLDAQGNTINNASINNPSISSISSANNIILNYDTDDSNTDKFEVQTGSAQTPLLRTNSTDVSILNRDLNMNSNDITSINNLIGGSGTQIVGLQSPDVNLQSNESVIANINAFGNTTGKFFAVRNQGTTGGTLFRVDQSGIVNVFGGALNMNSNAINNAASIDGGSAPVGFGDDIDMNGNDIDNVGNISGTSPIGVEDSFNMNSNDITSINNLTGGSGSQIVGLQSPDVNLESTDAIIANVNKDGANTGKFFAVRNQGTTGGDVLFVSQTGNVSIPAGPLNMNSNNVNNVASLDNGGSPIAMNDSIDLKSNSLNDVATIDGGTDDVGFQSPIFMDSNAIRLRGSGSDNHAIVYNSTVDGPEIRAFSTIRFTHTDTTNTIADFTDGSIDVKGNNIDNVTSIDGGGNAVTFNDDITMNDNSLNDVNSIDGGGNEVFITPSVNVPQINSTSNVDVNFDDDASGGEAFNVRAGTTPTTLFTVNFDGTSGNTQSIDVNSNNIDNVNDITGLGANSTNLAGNGGIYNTIGHAFSVTSFSVATGSTFEPLEFDTDATGEGTTTVSNSTLFSDAEGASDQVDTYTAPAAGVYYVSAHSRVTLSASNGDTADMQVAVNGTAISSSNREITATNVPEDQIISTEAVVSLASGDTVTIPVTTNVTTTEFLERSWTVYRIA